MVWKNLIRSIEIVHRIEIVRRIEHIRLIWNIRGIEKRPVRNTGRLVPKIGVEPIRCFHRGILSPLRLPIPPFRLMKLCLPLSRCAWRSLRRRRDEYGSSVYLFRHSGLYQFFVMQNTLYILAQRFTFVNKKQTTATSFVFWRHHPDLNWGWGFCRPLPYLLAMMPFDNQMIVAIATAYCKCGAGDGIRTRDFHLGKVTLYHWVTPASNSYYTKLRGKMQQFLLRIIKKCLSSGKSGFTERNFVL